MGNQSIFNACLRSNMDPTPPPARQNKTLHSTIPGTFVVEEHEFIEETMGPSYEASIQDSFYKSKQIGPYLPQEKSSSYQLKLKSWKQAIHETPVHGWKEFGESLDIDFKEKYAYCESKLDKALISYHIMNKQEFIGLIRLGPPNNRIRWSCWKLLLIKQSKLIDIDKCKLDGGSDAITKDVRRTLTQHPFFRSEDDGQTIAHKQLLKLLRGVSCLYPQLGYCQGMNFLAGFFLLISGGNENLSFQCMIQLLTNYRFLLYYMYSEQLELLTFMEFLTEKCIYAHLPQLAKHLFRVIEIPHSFWLTKLLLTLFLYSFRIETCLRFWDYLLTNNVFYLVSLILAFLRAHEQELMQIDDVYNMSEWFQKMQNVQTDNGLFKNSENYRIQFNQIRAYAEEFLIVNKGQTYRLIPQLKKYPDIKEFIAQDIGTTFE